MGFMAMHTWTKLGLWGTTALLALQLNGCCNILDRLSDDDDEKPQNDGPDPVTGDLPQPRNGFLADLGFRPRANGYNFENGGNAAYPRTPGFVGPAEMIRLFGAKEVCIGGRATGNNCRMTPALDGRGAGTKQIFVTPSGGGGLRAPRWQR